MSYSTLESYYKTLFSLQYHHKWPNVEELVPFERDIYVAMIGNYLQQVKEERQIQENAKNAMQRKGTF